jgi:hypothetical protein
MIDEALTKIRDIIQEDVGGRGLRADPTANLISATTGDFAAACHSIAEHPRPAAAIVTGFFIPDANPPAAETDGPLGALFLARCLSSLGIPVAILTDSFCRAALAAGSQRCQLGNMVSLLGLPSVADHWDQFIAKGWIPFARDRFHLTHLIAIERPGPSHTLASFEAQRGTGSQADDSYFAFLREVPPEHQDRCHRANGLDISIHVSPAHRLFESARRALDSLTTIGIGDGGNEIGMGNIPWDIIRRNIPGGGRIACRVPADHLLVCGVSNWGAYGLAAGIHLVRRHIPSRDLFDEQRERELLRIMVERGPLVDGVMKFPSLSVDGLSYERYIQPLRRIASVMQEVQHVR